MKIEVSSSHNILKLANRLVFKFNPWIVNNNEMLHTKTPWRGVLWQNTVMWCYMTKIPWRGVTPEQNTVTWCHVTKYHGVVPHDTIPWRGVTWHKTIWPYKVLCVNNSCTVCTLCFKNKKCTSIRLFKHGCIGIVWLEENK